MAQNDIWKRYMDAGLSIGKISRTKAEALVKDLVKNGEMQRDQAQKWVDELTEKSRKSTEEILDFVRQEVTKQVSQLKLVSRDDLPKLLNRLSGGDLISRAREAGMQARGTAAKPTAKKTAAKKTAAKKATATRTVAKKSVAKRTAAKKAPAKKTVAKKASITPTATAKKAPAKKSPAKKTVAKKAVAKRPS